MPFRAGRLSKIVLMIQAHGTLTATELAEKLEVTERTIYRDIEELIVHRVPIISQSGPGGGYSLPDGYTFDPSMFTPEESNILAIGGVAIQSLTDFHEDPTEIETAKAKLLSLFSGEEKKLLKRHLDYIYFDSSRWYRQYIHSKGVLNSIKTAVIHNRWLLIEYKERYDPLESALRSAKVEAYGLVFKSDTWYLVGYSYRTNEIRRWNVIRIHSAQLLDHDFERPPGFKLADWWREELEEFGKGTIRVLMAIKDAAWYRFERFQWKRENRFFVEDRRIVVEMIVDHYEWLIDIVMINRGEVEILEPPELREKIARAAEIIYKRHSQIDVEFPEDAHVIDFEAISTKLRNFE